MRQTTVCAWCGGAKNRRAKLVCFSCRQLQKRQNLLERFWGNVNAPDDGLCWFWLGRLDKDGYGRVRTKPGCTMQAHRFSYELHFAKQAPIDLQVCHSCDTANCVNPTHLFIGTQLDNMRDMCAKGRHAEQQRTRRRTLSLEVPVVL